MNLSLVTLHVPEQSKIAGRLDFVMMASGVLLILFLWAHLLLVSSVIISPGVMDALAEFFEATYMAQVGGPIIFLIMIIHFCLAARKMPFEQGEWKTFITHSKMLRHKDTTLWLVQVITAVLILIFASIHMFTVLSDLPITAVKSAARVQERSWLLLYLILLPMAELHVGYRLLPHRRQIRVYFQRAQGLVPEGRIYHDGWFYFYRPPYTRPTLFSQQLKHEVHHAGFLY